MTEFALPQTGRSREEVLDTMRAARDPGKGGWTARLFAGRAV